VLAHIHCHQQAIAGPDSAAAALRASGLTTRVLDAGCCGMAGAFGYDKQHYRVSVDVGERVLLPAVRDAPADTLIVTNGFSCREQISQLTGRRAHHMAEVLSSVLG
jgi:Fe-S oxidoreductase